MRQSPWVTGCALAGRRQRQHSPADPDRSAELATGGAGRYVFTAVRPGTTCAIFIVSQIVRCRLPVPLRSPGLRFTKGSESGDGAQQTGDMRRSRDTSISNLLAPAQQYLQALREDSSPPPELSEAWDAFYRACDPLVRRTVAACSLHRVDADDCVQEAWAEIAAKLTRFEYDENRGSFEAWLRIVVHRAACHHARRDHRQTAGRIDQDLAGVKCPRLLGPAMATQREELRASVRQTLDAFRPSVSSTAFQILVLTAVDDQTSSEIAKRLGLAPGHVRVLRHRTAENFRQFVATRPALAEAFGFSPSQNAAEISSPTNN